METLVKNEVTYSVNAESLTERIKVCINTIDKFVNENNYQVSNVSEYNKLKDSTYLFGIQLQLSKLSLNQRKKVRNALYRVNNNPTLRNVNYLLHILYTKVLKSDQRIKIKKSEKELAIEKARQEWITYRNEAERLRLAYKELKGDFYKNKLKQ